MSSKSALVAGLVVLAASPLAADVISVTGDGADRAVLQGSDFSSSNNDTQRVGSPGGSDYNQVFIFQLPELPDGHVISDADLQVYLVGVDGSGSWSTGADLYGLGVHTEASVAAFAADQGLAFRDLFYESATPDSRFTLIMEDLFTKFGARAAAGQYHATDDNADLALAGWLQSLYDDPSISAGDYVFFRLNQTWNAFGNNRGWDVGTGNETSPGRPVLSIQTVVPEPASLALLLAGGLLLCRKRAR